MGSRHWSWFHLRFPLADASRTHHWHEWPGRPPAQIMTRLHAAAKSRALPARLPVGGYRAVCMVVPALRSEIAYLWFNPPWIIPPTILREDVMPQGARRS